MDDVTAVETVALGGTLEAPGAIIDEPNTFTLNTKFTLKGPHAPLLNGKVFDVQHHFQRIEDGLNFRLNGGSVTAAVVGGQIEMPYTSVSFTTGPAGQLQIPPNETEGTFRVLTQLVAQDPNVRRIVSAFQDGTLLHVI
ncbi:hypothetical protein BJF90_17465 [Pseudonocardia sp. CNS-004]|nr:hypothetical protein BJF90_17465 [Pseudonocardia sp. CNS-004]